MNSAYSFFIGWGVILGLFYGSLRFEGTRTLTYYVLWLNIVLMIVTHSDTLKSLIEGAVPSQPATDSSGQQTQQSQNIGEPYVLFGTVSR